MEIDILIMNYSECCSGSSVVTRTFLGTCGEAEAMDGSLKLTVNGCGSWRDDCDGPETQLLENARSIMFP